VLAQVDADNFRAVQLLDQPAALAPPAASPNLQVMSLPPIEVKLPPTPAEISRLNSSLKVDNPSEVSIDILPGVEIPSGVRVSLRVSAKKPGYLVLVDVDPAGKVTQIYPNPMSLSAGSAARQSTNYLRPGGLHQIPNPSEPFEFMASPPFGTAMVVAILSERPMQTINLPHV